MKRVISIIASASGDLEKNAPYVPAGGPGRFVCLIHRPALAQGLATLSWKLSLGGVFPHKPQWSTRQTAQADSPIMSVPD